MAATTVDEEITLAPDDDDDDIVVSPVTVVTTVVPSTEPCGAPPQLGKLDSKSSTQFRFSLPLSVSYSHYYISLSISFFLVCNPVQPILLSYLTFNYSRTQTRCSHGRHVLDYI